MALSPARSTLPGSARARSLRLAAGALLTACSAGDGVRHSDAVFPVEADLHEWYVRRVVDDLTGTPIRGAEVLLVPERRTPVGGESWFSHRGVSDGDGFVRIRLPQAQRDWQLQVLRHPDHGIATESANCIPIWRIGRALDVPVRVEDWRGRPVAGARIGFCGGCGHTPDLVSATTGQDGVAVLRGIDPHNHIADVYVQHPGLGLGYDSIRWYPGDPPAVVACGWAPAKSGWLLDHRGQPVAGAHVGALDVHRGPWARTAADGSFTVLGAPPDTEVHVAVIGEREVHFDHGGGYPVTLQLPDLADPDAHQGTVRAAAAAAAAAPAVRSVRVRVEGAPGEATLGTEFPGRPSQRDGVRPGAEVEIPASGPFVLHALAGDGRRRWSFDDGAAVADPLVVVWTPDVRVTGRAVDATGRPVAVAVRWRSRWSAGHEGDEAGLQPFPSGGFELRPWHAGAALLELVPQSPALRPRLLWLSLPERGTAEALHLGDVVLAATPRLCVLGTDGRPRRDVVVGFARAGWQQAGDAHCWPLDADGGWLGPDLCAGDAIVVGQQGARLPFRVVLQGDGPWQVEVPDGELALSIAGPDGAPLAAQVVVGDHAVDADGGVARLRGLPYGAHRLFVSAPGHRTAIVDAVVGAVPKSLRVMLPSR